MCHSAYYWAIMGSNTHRKLPKCTSLGDDGVVCVFLPGHEQQWTFKGNVANDLRVAS